MILCIFFGTLTHYYFYVYAAGLSFFIIIFFIYKRRQYELFNYIYSGIVGIALSWIFFPWVFFHIFFGSKHSEILPWSFDKLKEYIAFCNEKLFNGRMGAAVLILFLLYFMAQLSKNKKENNEISEHLFFRHMIIGSGIIYSLVIYTLDGGTQYYSTPFYMTFIIWISMVLIDFIKKICFFREKDVSVIIMAVGCAVAICSVSTAKQYMENAADIVTRTINHDSFKDEFHRISEDYKYCDCIFIELAQNGLLQNYWFEFGEYDEFKKITIEDFNQYGICEEDFDGRKTEGDILIYAPAYISFDESGYQFLASDNLYNIYLVRGGK